MSDTTKIDDGGPAFSTDHSPGMTLRAYLTGQAMVGLLCARNGFLVDIGTESVGRWSVQCADATIAALKEGGDK